MTPEGWRRVGELFHEALEVPEPNRFAWVQRACASDQEMHDELISLLENDSTIANGFVERQVKSAVVLFYEGSKVEWQGQRIGPYKLVRELGHGGMGTVYLAERDDDEYQTSVAIKLVRQAMDTEIILHQFRRERQILAHLEHPNIARLFDGGTTADGRPYIVMEYVPGVPITEYCISHSLTIEQRLMLFLDVCSAVEYAHRNFVVHRDLKPGNILISEAGIAKLLDFGICKLLHSEPTVSEATSDTLRMLTPEYASPEQISGDPITIASDIYSLAAILYELLTGFKAHRIEKCTPQAIERAICFNEVIRPSVVPNKQLARRLKGDLENIVMLALEKEPQRRYATVEQFAEDIRRHLSHQPVRARPDTVAYRLRKFARRSRTGLLAAAAVMLCLLAGIGLTWREAQIANSNLLQARRLANIFVFDVHDAVRDLPGSTRARQLIVKTGLQFLDGIAGTSRRDWGLKSELAAAYQRIGDVQGNVLGANLGNTRAALESYRKAMALLDATVAHDPGNRKAQLDLITVQQRIAAIYTYTQDTGQAIASFEKAQTDGEAALARNPRDEQIATQLAQIYVAKANALWIRGSYVASIDDNSKAVSLAQRFQSAESSNRPMLKTLADAYSAIGMDETRLGRLQDSLRDYQKALTILRKLSDQDPANGSYRRAMMWTFSHLGDALGNPKWRSMGDIAGALKAYQQMLALARQMYETDPANQQAASDYAIALTRLAAALPEVDSRERLSMLRESLKLLRGVERVNTQNAMNRWDLSHGYSLLGDALMTAGDHPGAIQAYEESVSLAEALLALGVTSPAPDLVAIHEKLGIEAARSGSRERALLHARRALQISDPAGVFAKGRTENVQRYLTPRGTAAMGLIYTELARAERAQPTQAREDQREAARWLVKSLPAWRNLEADPDFAPPHRREMQQVEKALSQLGQL